MNAENLRDVALAVAAERSVDRVLSQIVQGLVDRSSVALARVWLIDDGDICASCPMSSECPDRARCLHLAASAGAPLDPHADWSRLTGGFRRFPLSRRKIGRIAASGQGIFLADVGRDGDWIVDPAWVQREGIRSFGGQPLVFRGEILGVLGVFSRDPCNAETFAWLRAFADHAAIAIAHARALAEIQRLQDQLQLENAFLREDIRRDAPSGFVGTSPALGRALEQIAAVAPTTATVLIEGESGTGKELAARAVHDLSARRHRPLISVNCASIPRELFESEFFGHVKGAFTGAQRDRAGRFQAADGGTLFLDEVGEIPLDLQGKLLRVLQDGKFERVGEDVTRTVDVRIVAATNRNLEQEVASGRFRRDLFYRLSVFPVVLPPLRDRVEDVQPLAAHFVQLAARRFGRPAPRLTMAACRALEAYAWPGNIRELQHVVDRAMLLSRGDVLRVDGLLGASLASHADSAPSSSEAKAVVPEAEWKRREQANLRLALKLSRGRIYGREGAAALLGVKPTTLVSRLKALGVRYGDR